MKILITGNEAQSSVIINVYEKFNVKAKIISAQLEYVGHLNFGILILELQGKNTNEALVYLENEYVNSEIRLCRIVSSICYFKGRLRQL